MALYALGDMHLAFSVDKPMDKFGRVWRKHEQKIEKNCGRMIQDEGYLCNHGGSFLGEKPRGGEPGSRFYCGASRKEDPAERQSRYVLGREEDSSL